MLSRLARLVLLLFIALPASAQQGLDAAVIERARLMAETAARTVAPPGARVVVEAGTLDARLRLAPCAEIQPFLPAGMAAWGRTRVGLRCLVGASKWSVTVPMQVRVFARAVVSAGPLPAGAILTQEMLATAEIDSAAEAGAVFLEPNQVLGRSLARPLGSGEPLRQSHLKSRQWFSAGETVQVSVAGPGFAIGTEGQALSAGLEGQDVRVRVEGGRVLTGRAVGERRVELML